MAADATVPRMTAFALPYLRPLAETARIPAPVAKAHASAPARMPRGAHRAAEATRATAMTIRAIPLAFTAARKESTMPFSSRAW